MEGFATTSTPKMDWSSGDLPAALKSFQQHCEFAFGGPLKGKSEEQRCNYLMLWVGEKGRDVYKTWNLTSEESKKLSTYYEKFEAYVKPKSNNIFSRYKFHTIVQQEKESFEQFLTKLKIEVKDCGYKEPDEMVRDRVVIGCYSQKLREKLIQEGSELTLEKAVDIAQTQEMSCTQLRCMTTEDQNVHSLREQRARKFKYKDDKRPRKPIEHEHPCGKCGLKHEKSKCPAEGKKCAKCTKPNHFARVCKSKPKERKSVYGVEENQDSDDEPYMFVGAIGTKDATGGKEWYEDIKIAGKTINVQLDTGARCNVVLTKDLQQLGTKISMMEPEAKLKSYSGHVIATKAVTTLPCVYKEKTYHVKFHVVDIPAPPVFSANTCKEMGLIKRVHSFKPLTSQDQSHHDFQPKHDSTVKDELLQGHSKLFTGLGCLPGEHTIKIDPSISPVLHPPRRIPLSLKDRVINELKRMEESGVIVKQTGPTEWVNSMVTVIKPEKIRVCIDPRDLNRAIKREHYPMKTIE